MEEQVKTIEDIQALFTKANQIYKITKDIDLGGGTLTIPEGCTLDFQGGSFSNGSIDFVNTQLTGEIKCLTKISGTVNNFVIYPDWFGLEYNVIKNNNVQIINDAVKVAANSKTVLQFKAGNIYIDAVQGEQSDWGVSTPTIKVLSNSIIKLDSNTVITVNSNNFERYHLFELVNCENVTIEGGTLVGDLRTHTGDAGEFGFGIYIRGGKNITIKNISINEFWGDGIILAYDSITQESTPKNLLNSIKHPRNIVIENVECKRNRRQGISITDGINCKIINSKFNETGTILATAPTSGMDIEPSGSWEYIKDLLCINCEFKNNKGFNLTSWFNDQSDPESPVTADNMINGKFINCDFTSQDNAGKVNGQLAETEYINCTFNRLQSVSSGGFTAVNCILDNLALFGKTSQQRILKNCTIQFSNIYDNYLISYEGVSLKDCYLKDCLFKINNSDLVNLDWGTASYLKDIKILNPTFINVGDNSDYEVFVSKTTLYSPTAINCKIETVQSELPVPTIHYDIYKDNVTGINTATFDNGVVYIDQIPLFLKDGKYINFIGLTGTTLRGSNGEHPSLQAEDEGYLYYNTSYDRWEYWNKSTWKDISTNLSVGSLPAGTEIPNTDLLNGRSYFLLKSNNPVVKYLNGKQCFYVYEKWVDSFGNPYDAKSYGETEERPTNINIGTQYFDTTLNKPIWYTGSKWVDATGAEV